MLSAMTVVQLEWQFAGMENGTSLTERGNLTPIKNI